MILTDTIPIVFAAGTYGTYLEWALSTLVLGLPPTDPLTNTGNSHNFKGNHLHNMQGWHEYVTSNQPVQFVRFHPKTQQNQSLSDNLNKVLATVDRAIYIYPEESATLLSLNNSCTKVWESWWNHTFSNDLSSDVLYNNWPISRDINVNNVAKWIQREFLSHYLMPMWQAQLEWDHTKTWANPRCLVVGVNELLLQPTLTFDKIKSFCNLEYVQSLETIMPLHEKMLSMQNNLGQDQICRDIIDSVQQQTELDWNTLPLASEAWVQWQLRNLGWEIKCHGLDIFPTNSVYLKELLYNV